MAGLHNDGPSMTAQSRVHQSQGFMLEEVAQPSVPIIQERKEPLVSFPDKFDGTRSRFRGFVKQMRLITALQAERYPTKESRCRGERITLREHTGCLAAILEGS